MPKILIIDDENMIRERLSQLLSLDGFESVSAESGAEGLRVFYEQKPDISLVDIKMPGLSGIDVLKSIKTKEEGDSEVIMITGHGGSDTIIQALNEGAFGYVQKPIEYDELLIIIRKALEKIAMRRQLKEYVVHLEQAFMEKSQELTLRIQAERALQENIDQAKEYQRKLVMVTSPQVYNLRFYSDYIPYAKVGGDILNVIKVEECVLFYVADIVGHGVVAAILSTFIKANLDRWIKYVGIKSPLEIITRLKELLKEQSIFQENMLALFIGSLHTKTLLLTYVNAGQFRPLLCFKDPVTGEEEYQQLPGTSYPLSDILNDRKHVENIFQLRNNTKVLVYSDGLIERLDGNYEIIGTKGLHSYCKTHGLSKESLSYFINKNSSQLQTDDISYILLNLTDSFTKDYNCDLSGINQAALEIQEELLVRYPETPALSRALQCYYEVFANAIEHGHKNNKEKKTRVNLFCKDEAVIIQIIDEGEGFNWQSLTKQQPPADSHRGRGLYLVQRLCESLVFNNPGNEITIEIALKANNNRS
jgi:DNA-binding response OmpR family regulator/anti-sigma regulatory factor (Ser/Thr protein kinase)